MGRRSASCAARQRPYASLRRRTVAQDAAMHSLRGVHEPLPGLYADRRACLRDDLPGADWQDHFTAYARAGGDLFHGHRVVALRGLWRGLSGEDSDSGFVDALAGRVVYGAACESFDAWAGAGYSWLMTSVWKGWAAVYRSPSLYGVATWLGSRFSWLMPSKQGAWTSVRVALKPAPKRLRDMLRERG